MTQDEQAPRPSRAYGGKSAEARRQDRRRRILDAGLELYGTQGFAPTTISQLTRVAGIAPANFYEQFEDQASVVLQVSEEVGMEAVARVFDAVTAAPPDLYETSRAGLMAFCHSLLDDPRRARVLLVEVVGVSPYVEQRRHESLDGFATLLLHRFFTLTGHEWEPGGESDRERIVATAMVGAVNAAMVAWMRTPESQRMSVDELAETLAGLFLVVGTWLAPPDGRPA